MKHLNSRMPRIPEEYGGCGGGRDEGVLVGSMQVPLDKMGQLQRSNAHPCATETVFHGKCSSPNGNITGGHACECCFQ